MIVCLCLSVFISRAPNMELKRGVVIMYNIQLGGTCMCIGECTICTVVVTCCILILLNEY